MRRPRRASRPTFTAAAALAFACGAPDVQDNGLPPQGPQSSQAGLVTQSIHTTDVSVHYYRPVARGRELFGSLVKWDEMWTPGANRATYLTTTGDLRVDGYPLAAGSYSIWLRPRAEGPWELVFSDAWDVYHLPYPEGEDRLRLEVTPEEAAHMETLAVYFPSVDGYEATLRIHWGTTAISLHLEVPSS